MEIIFTVPFDEVEVQAHAEANYGRELTGVELNRMKKCWSECDRVDWHKMQLLDAVINEAIKDKGWKDVDDAYLTTK